MSMVCGAARVPMPRYLWTTAVGYLPITAYFTYLGSQLEGFSVEDPIVWIGAGGFVLAIFGVRFLLPRRRGRLCGGPSGRSLGGIGRQRLEAREAAGHLPQLRVALGEQAVGGVRELPEGGLAGVVQ